MKLGTANSLFCFKAQLACLTLIDMSRSLDEQLTTSLNQTDILISTGLVREAASLSRFDRLYRPKRTSIVLLQGENFVPKTAATLLLPA